jgi:DNA invertase Pin-like site-specific DNA recombinase
MFDQARHVRAEGRSAATVVQWQHRLGRRTLAALQRRKEFQSLGIPIHSVAEGGEVSDLIATVMPGVAEHEVQQLGDRITLFGLPAGAKGWSKTGPEPWGYRWRTATPEERSDGSLESVLDIDRVAVPHVFEFFRNIAENRTSIRSTQPWLTALPPAILGGRLVTGRTILDLLRSQVYVARVYDGDDAAAHPAHVT